MLIMEKLPLQIRYATATACVSVGDTATLKSGGPLMVVVNPTHAGGIACQWFHDSLLHTAAFPVGALLFRQQRIVQNDAAEID